MIKIEIDKTGLVIILCSFVYLLWTPITIKGFQALTFDDFSLVFILTIGVYVYALFIYFILKYLAKKIFKFLTYIYKKVFK